jgi:hyaluronoglucosaminidase
MIPELGLIEGFFGRPYSWEDRAGAVRFLADTPYRFYFYAPKADPWLRRRWQEEFPIEHRDRLAQFGGICRDSGWRLGVGLSPFELHLHTDTEWQEPLARKLAEIDQIGADDLGLLFDDMRGDIADLADRQAEIVHFAAAHSKATRILCCPSYYSDDPILDAAFGDRPAFYLERLGRLLDPDIRIMWTGEEVVSREYSPGHLARVAETIGRKPFLWDNYPVNDGSLMAQHLHLRAFTGRPASIAPYVAAHGINLASQPVLSRIPALTLAESYQKGAEYHYGQAFDRAASRVLGKDLAAKVRRDLLALQDRGLGRLAERLSTLRERYAEFDHPGAAEIVAWLDGAWSVTDELVQTQ